MIEMEKEWAAMNPNLQGEGASQYAQNLLDNASMYSCLGVQAILKHHTGAISKAQMEQTLHELASQGFRYYDDVKKYGKRNPFSQQYNLNIGRGTEKIHLMLRCLTGITGKKINILTARVSD